MTFDLKTASIFFIARNLLMLLGLQRATMIYLPR